MINICVWPHKVVDIEGTLYKVETQEGVEQLIKAVLDKAYYAGERLCLERVTMKENTVYYRELERWSTT